MSQTPASTLVIWILGFCLIVMVVGGGIMDFMGRTVNPQYYAIIFAIVTGLLGILGTTGKPKEAQDVKVVNTQADPAIVEETK
jgi:hypothetical protein